MTDRDTQGRFLPSRTYSRWRWTVRFGLMTVPLLTLIFGVIELYLTPKKYLSTCVFSVANGPQPEDIATLASSETVVGNAVRVLNLQKWMDTDTSSATQSVIKNLSVEVVPGTRQIKLKCLFSKREAARDIADEIPKQVLQHLTQGVEKDLAVRMGKLGKLIQDALDMADQKAADLAKLGKVHQGNSDEATQHVIDRAKRASLLADAEVERLQNLMAEARLADLKSLPRLDIATAPNISDHAHSPDVAGELGDLFARSLLYGLIAALALPYFLELAFPPNETEPRLQPAFDL